MVRWAFRAHETYANYVAARVQHPAAVLPPFNTRSAARLPRPASPRNAAARTAANDAALTAATAAAPTAGDAPTFLRRRYARSPRSTRPAPAAPRRARSPRLAYLAAPKRVAAPPAEVGADPVRPLLTPRSSRAAAWSR